jgi:hypothetical protein
VIGAVFAPEQSAPLDPTEGHAAALLEEDEARLAALNEVTSGAPGA